MKTQLKADFALILVTVCWGVSYFLMDLCLEEMEPFTLNAFRFLGAFAVSADIMFPRLRNVSRATLKYALYIGIALTLVYSGCTFGLQYTTQSNAGFLCAMTVIFTPIFAFVFRRVVPGRKMLLVLLLCLVGIALMTLDEKLHIGKGDLLCLMCAMAYALDLLITERAVSQEDVDALQLGVFQLFFTGLFMLALAIVFEQPAFPVSPAGWASAVFLSIFCTGVSFIVQSVAQQYTTASHVGVIFCLEPVFASIVAFFLAGEVLLPRAYAGAVLMLAGLLIMEIQIPRKGRTDVNNSKKCENACSQAEQI